MKLWKVRVLPLAFFIAIVIFSCTAAPENKTAGGGGDTVLNNVWTWVSGTNIAGLTGTYGVKGVPDPANIPGSRMYGSGWIDASGNLWLFGGYGQDAVNISFNDLWKYDVVSKNWTWVSGTNAANQAGIYGTKGVAADTNVPGARYYSTSWMDGSGNLWIFGGFGYDSAGTEGYLSDLWKFDGSNWTWVSGTNIAYIRGKYGIKGTASVSNLPGARAFSVSWIDASGNLWLFGGNGRDGTGANGYLNDLWKFDGSNWTWVSGSSNRNEAGIYGTMGTANAANVPGGRCGSVGWKDVSGNFWLFGGYGFVSTLSGYLNDLWKYDTGSGMWTWVSGTNLINHNGIFGIRGVASDSNMPSTRTESVGWIDASGNLWVFGGYGRDSAGSSSCLNDVWKFDMTTTNWTWIAGSNIIDQNGVYGTLGTASSANTPGSRNGCTAITGNDGCFWLFGGYGFDCIGGNTYLNDLWKYKP